MILSLEKLSYYLGGVGVLLIICVVYYFIQGKKDVEEALRKQFEQNEKARIAEGNGGLYTLCPTNPPGGTEGGTEGNEDNPPGILICDPSGMVGGKIDSVVPKVSYANYPKSEEDRAWLRRDFVIQMIVADGGTAF